MKYIVIISYSLGMIKNQVTTSDNEKIQFDGLFHNV